MSHATPYIWYKSTVSHKRMSYVTQTNVTRSIYYEFTVSHAQISHATHTQYKSTVWHIRMSYVTHTNVTRWIYYEFTVSHAQISHATHIYDFRIYVRHGWFVRVIRWIRSIFTVSHAQISHPHIYTIHRVTRTDELGLTYECAQVSMMWVLRVIRTNDLRMNEPRHTYVSHVNAPRSSWYFTNSMCAGVCGSVYECVARLICMCGMAHLYVWHGSFVCVTWLYIW